jgi:hypothetical protein
MNKRIRELAEQAERYADENFKGEPNWSEAYESKFAELIIRECMNIADRISAYDVMDDIAQRFGVDL